MLLLTGNLLFIPLDSDRTFIPNTSTKYVAASISGQVMTSEIYTEQEIRAKYGLDVKQCSDFLALKSIY